MFLDDLKLVFDGMDNFAFDFTIFINGAIV